METYSRVQLNKNMHHKFHNRLSPQSYDWLHLMRLGVANGSRISGHSVSVGAPDPNIVYSSHYSMCSYFPVVLHVTDSSLSSSRRYERGPTLTRYPGPYQTLFSPMPVRSSRPRLEARQSGEGGCCSGKTSANTCLRVDEFFFHRCNEP